MEIDYEREEENLEINFCLLYFVDYFDISKNKIFFRML